MKLDKLIKKLEAQAGRNIHDTATQVALVCLTGLAMVDKLIEAAKEEQSERQ